MPLSPVAMLILRRQPSMSPLRVDQRRFHDYNADIALQCYESSCASPGAVAGWTTRTSRNRPVVRFNIGPAVEDIGDGTQLPMDDVIQKWIPLRAIDPIPTASGQ
jgi:hypothetical protein